MPRNKTKVVTVYVENFKVKCRPKGGNVRLKLGEDVVWHSKGGIKFQIAMEPIDFQGGPAGKPWPVKGQGPKKRKFTDKAKTLRLIPDQPGVWKYTIRADFAFDLDPIIIVDPKH